VIDLNGAADLNRAVPGRTDLLSGQEGIPAMISMARWLARQRRSGS